MSLPHDSFGGTLTAALIVTLALILLAHILVGAGG
jgi:hypothetical protein